MSTMINAMQRVEDLNFSDSVLTRMSLNEDQPWKSKKRGKSTYSNTQPLILSLCT